MDLHSFQYFITIVDGWLNLMGDHLISGLVISFGDSGACSKHSSGL
jgi:hypothetical protein